jgi:hypothetical protein
MDVLKVTPGQLKQEWTALVFATRARRPQPRISAGSLESVSARALASSVAVIASTSCLPLLQQSKEHHPVLWQQLQLHVLAAILPSWTRRPVLWQQINCCKNSTQLADAKLLPQNWPTLLWMGGQARERIIAHLPAGLGRVAERVHELQQRLRGAAATVGTSSQLLLQAIDQRRDAGGKGAVVGAAQQLQQQHVPHLRQGHEGHDGPANTVPKRLRHNAPL